MDAARILVGTCSWTDPTLIASGRFYPAGVTSAESRLRFYAEQFPVVEVDSTYYAPLVAHNAELWVRRTPPDFVVNVKAYALLTGHPADTAAMPPWLRDGITAEASGKRRVYARDVAGTAMEQLWAEHRAALTPLIAAGKLGAVLFQFPPWFTRSRASIDYLRRLPHRVPGARLAVEFRGGGWMEPDRAPRTLSLLEETGLTYVVVDEPQGFTSSTPPVTAATGGLAMIRLHGRNSATWDARTRVASDRFKYLYADEELEEWAPRVRELAATAAEVHVLFNNNFEDWGMRNARRMANLLGVGAAPPQTRFDLGAGAS